MSYATKTKVSVERSETELRKLLRKAGATAIVSASDENRGRHVVVFELDGRRIRLEVFEPDRSAFIYTETGRVRPEAYVDSQIEQERRRLWRVLVLVTKAKLELIASGDSWVEREFLADILLPNGKTVYNDVADKIETAYLTGKMPKLLPPGS